MSSSIFNSSGKRASDGKRICQFLLLTLAILILVDRSAGNGLLLLHQATRNGSTGGKLNYFLEHHSSDPFDCVILGSSRAHYHVDPRILSYRSFNLAHSGMETSFHAGLIHILRQHDCLPGLVVLQVEPAAFVRSPYAEDSSVKFLSPYYGTNQKLKEMIDELGVGEQIKSISLLYRFNGKVLGVVKNALLRGKVEQLGFAISPPTAGDAERVEFSMKNIKSTLPDKSNAEEVRLLVKIIDACNESPSVSLIAFSSPVAHDVTTDQRRACKLLSEFFRERGVTYLDYYSDKPESLADYSKWHDATHLNSEGAAVFTKILERDISKTLSTKE